MIFVLALTYCTNIINSNNIYTIYIGRRKIARSTVPPKAPCKYCDKQGHSSAHCHAKETGIILVLYNLLKELLFLERVPVALINLLRNKAPPITIERLSGHYEDIAETSDDELDADDKSTNSSKKVTIEEVYNAPCFFGPPPEISRMAEVPTSPQPKDQSTYAASTGICT